MPIYQTVEQLQLPLVIPIAASQSFTEQIFPAMKDPAAVEYFVADHAPRQSDLVDLASGPASIATKAQPCMTKSDLVQNCPTKKFTQTEMPLNPQSSETLSQAQQSMVSAADLWDIEPRSRVVDRAVVQLEAKTQTSNAARKPNLVHAQVKSAQIDTTSF